jgi:hypothetical protein
MKRTAENAMVTAIGVFNGYAEARKAVEALRAAGYQDDQIGVIGPHDAEAHQKRSGLQNDPTFTHWEEGAEIGAAAGGLAGLGLGAAVAAGLMSPLGPVIAGGTLVGLIASAGAGAAVGGVVGALVGLGVPEEDAKWYVSELQAGRVIVTVRAASGEEARNILEQHGAINLRHNREGEPHSDETAIPGNALPATPY